MDEPLSEINVTPLVDVMLVLLVIFILTAPVLAQALKVELPRASAPQAVERNVMTLVLRHDGTLEFDGQSLSRQQLARMLHETIQRRPQAVLRLAADAAVPYQQVIDAVSIAHQAGVQRLAFATRRP